MLGVEADGFQGVAGGDFDMTVGVQYAVSQSRNVFRQVDRLRVAVGMEPLLDQGHRLHPQEVFLHRPAGVGVGQMAGLDTEQTRQLLEVADSPVVLLLHQVLVFLTGSPVFSV